MSRLRDIKRRGRGDLHREMSVPALYISAPDATPVECTVRVWRKAEAPMVGALPGSGSQYAERVEPEDRLRFDLSDLTPRRTAIVSVEAGEAYRIEFLYPVDAGYQTARVTALPATDTTGLPVPA